MSFAEVLAEIPVFTRQQRRELSLRLIEIDSSAAELEDMAICEHSADEGFAVMNLMEAENSPQ